MISQVPGQLSVFDWLNSLTPVAVMEQKQSCFQVKEEDIGASALTNAKLAKKAAVDCVLSNKAKIIAKESILSAIKRFTAWHYIRKCDGREMVAFVAELNNGMLYCKDFYTYKHILIPKRGVSYDSVFKKLEKNAKESKGSVFENFPIENYVKNMYICKNEVDWDYSEAGYSGLRSYSFGY